MRAAPAFQLTCGPGAAERSAVAVLAGACAAVVAAWLWSHIDAAAGPAGKGSMPWLWVGAGAALLGSGLGWMLMPLQQGTIAWQQGRWSLQRSAAQAVEGGLEAKLDLGSWMLLRFRPAGSGSIIWLCVDRSGSGAAWHALRATLFAPGVAESARDGADEGARS
jgi:hypothetical protein